MKYILVGKQSAVLNGIKDKLIGDIDVFNTPYNLDNIDKSKNKIIYVQTPLMYDWDWWMSADISNEYNRKKFINEIMDFRNIDEDCCDLKLNFDGTGVTDMIDSINKYITEVENGSNTILN